MDHGKTPVNETVASVFAEIQADDDQVRAALVVKNKERPYDPPNSFRVHGIDDINTFVTSIPDQVHILCVSRRDKNAVIKLSYTGRTRKFNAHCGLTNAYGEVLSASLFEQLAKEVDEELMPELRGFLTGVRNDQ